MHALTLALTAATPSPSPSINEFQQAVESWPEPPRWLYIALAIVVVLLVLLIVVTVASSLATWSTRKKRDIPPRTTDWVDLSSIDGRTRGVDRHDGPGSHTPPVQGDSGARDSGARDSGESGSGESDSGESDSGASESGSDS